MKIISEDSKGFGRGCQEIWIERDRVCGCICREREVKEGGERGRTPRDKYMDGWINR